MRTVAVIGKNFGDEGKGLAVHYFSLHSKHTLIVRHNGGAQSGHTVVQKSPGRKRFVFHELSAGSCNGAETLWADSFYPDIYKLGEEIQRFQETFGFCPTVYGMEDVCITTPDDVLLNMALESSRGAKRHGSCGMGINECDLRTRAGFGLSLRRIWDMNEEELYLALRRIRKEYTARRLELLRESLTEAADGYIELLSNDNVLINAAREIRSNMRYVKLLTEASLREKLQSVDTLIFETGQGLLLDRNNVVYAPYVTASNTGLKNPCSFLSRFGLTLDEAVYVSRTYVTRHGPGPLPNECLREQLGNIQKDATNEPNLWQGTLRYARHESEEDFVAAIREDLAGNAATDCRVSLFLTHLNETKGCVLMKHEQIPLDAFLERTPIRETFDKVYTSASEYSEDTGSSMNVLSIGNSFSQDAHRYLHQIAAADGVELYACNLYIGGCSLSRHYRNMEAEARAYALEVNGRDTGRLVSLKEALQLRRWDVITVQQASHRSADYGTYQPYLDRLLDDVRQFAPKAKIGLHQTWAYEQDSEKLRQVMGHNDAGRMLREVVSANAQAAQHIGADFLIPSGEVFGALVKKGLGKIHRDTFHASLGLGRYALGLTWYRTLTGRDVAENAFGDFDEPVSPTQVATAKACVTEITNQYR